MRLCVLLCAAICLDLAAEAVISRSGPNKEAKSDRVTELIRQLGDVKFAKREAASKELAALGEPALDALRKAAATEEDFEIRRRAEQIVKVIVPVSSHSKSTGLTLALIDAGEFQMGAPQGETGRRNDELQHRVRITRPFYLGAFEVTQDEYQLVMKTNPSWFTSKGAGKDKVAGLNTDRFPVEQVTWYDAVEFCNQLSKKDGYEPYYRLTAVKRQGDSISSAKVMIVGGNGYRLPTEAEWEYACRAGTTTPFHFGNSITTRLANVKGGAAVGGYGAPAQLPELRRTTTVGSYKPNRWGLYDMHGNATEWCWDWYDGDYYTASPPQDPRGPESGIHRVVRGGSWLVSNGNSRSAGRFRHTPDSREYYGGFRVARTPQSVVAGK